MTKKEYKKKLEAALRITGGNYSQAEIIVIANSPGAKKRGRRLMKRRMKQLKKK